MIKCPHCGKKDCIADVVYANIENYDGHMFDLPCTECGNMIQVFGERRAVITEIRKSDKSKEESDF